VAKPENKDDRYWSTRWEKPREASGFVTFFKVLAIAALGVVGLVIMLIATCFSSL